VKTPEIDLPHSASLDNFFCKKIADTMSHQKLDVQGVDVIVNINDLDKQSKEVKGNFLFHVAQDDYDSKEFSFYKQIIKAKNVSLQPVKESEYNLEHVILDDLIAQRAAEAEIGKKMREEIEAKKSRRRNFAGSIGSYLKGVLSGELTNGVSAGEKLTMIMARHPSVFKLKYVLQHRKKLQRAAANNQPLLAEDSKEAKAAANYEQRVKALTRGALEKRTKQILTTKMDSIQSDQKRIAKGPLTRADMLHSARGKKELSETAYPPSWLSSSHIASCLKKPLPNKSSIKVNQAIHSWIVNRDA